MKTAGVKENPNKSEKKRITFGFLEPVLNFGPGIKQDQSQVQRVGECQTNREHFPRAEGQGYKGTWVFGAAKVGLGR